MACIINNGYVECMPVWVVVVLTVICTITVAILYNKYGRGKK